MRTSRPLPSVCRTKGMFIGAAARSPLNRTGNFVHRKPLMATRMLLLVAAGELLGMTLWFSATAAAPAIADEFRMSVSATAWLTMAVQAGFVVGTLMSAPSNLADFI